MNIDIDIFERIIDKINVKFASLLISFLLIAAGIKMSLEQIKDHGSIEWKSSLISGHLQTGSLGLLVIFLGIVIIVAVLFRSGDMIHKRGEKIILEFDEVKVICENLSFRKVKEIREILSNQNPGDIKKFE